MKNCNPPIKIRPVISYVCPFCDTWFGCKKHLIEHIREQGYVMPPIKFKFLKPR